MEHNMEKVMDEVGVCDGPKYHQNRIKGFNLLLQKGGLQENDFLLRIRNMCMTLVDWSITFHRCKVFRVMQDNLHQT